MWQHALQQQNSCCATNCKALTAMYKSVASVAQVVLWRARCATALPLDLHLNLWLVGFHIYIHKMYNTIYVYVQAFEFVYCNVCACCNMPSRRSSSSGSVVKHVLRCTRCSFCCCYIIFCLYFQHTRLYVCMWQRFPWASMSCSRAALLFFSLHSMCCICCLSSELLVERAVHSAVVVGRAVGEALGKCRLLRIMVLCLLLPALVLQTSTSTAMAHQRTD